ncbi:MAG: PqiC family protein [Cocleimonas sp.]
MMIFIKRGIIINLILFLVVACTSNNSATFYLLKPIPSSNLKFTQNNAAIDKITVLVKLVNFPEYLDQPQMVIRENDYKLQINEDHRWAEPIVNDFTRVFVKNLDSRIAPNDARVYSRLDGVKPDYQLSIEVFQMDVNMDDEAVLKTEWSLSTGKKAKWVTRRSSEYKVTIKDNSFESGVEAQSKAIGLLADQIAEYLQTLQKPSTTKNYSPTHFLDNNIPR